MNSLNLNLKSFLKIFLVSSVPLVAWSSSRTNNLKPSIKSRNDKIPNDSPRKRIMNMYTSPLKNDFDLPTNIANNTLAPMRKI